MGAVRWVYWNPATGETATGSHRPLDRKAWVKGCFFEGRRLLHIGFWAPAWTGDAEPPAEAYDTAYRVAGGALAAWLGARLVPREGLKVVFFRAAETADIEI